MNPSTLPHLTLLIAVMKNISQLHAVINTIMSRINNLSFKFQNKKRPKHVTLQNIANAYIIGTFLIPFNHEHIPFARLNTIKYDTTTIGILLGMRFFRHKMHIPNVTTDKTNSHHPWNRKSVFFRRKRRDT